MLSRSDITYKCWKFVKLHVLLFKLGVVGNKLLHRSSVDDYVTRVWVARMKYGDGNR